MFDISKVDQIPVALTRVVPVYPASLRKAKVEGTVIAGFVLDELGKVGDLQVVSSTDHGFEQATLDALGQWTFSPGLKDGRPVKVRMSVPIVFSLNGEKPGN